MPTTTPRCLLLVLLAAATGVARGASGDVLFPPPPPAVARRLAATIERLGREVKPAERDALFDQIVDAGSEAIPILLAEIEKRNPRTWSLGIQALGAIGDPRVIPRLREELKGLRGRPAMDVLYALALAGDRRALVDALRSTHATVSFEQGTTAVDYIAGALGPDAVPTLIEEIPRRAKNSRVAGLGALGTIADASAVPFLLRWSRQPEPLDRRFALMALARIGDPRAAPRLIEALEDPDLDVRVAAAEGLGYLRAEEAIPRLAALLGKPSVLRPKAIWSLGLIGGPEAAAALRASWTDVSELEKPLVVEALGRAGDPESAPLLGEIARGEDTQLASLAVDALSRLHGPASSAALLAACSGAGSHETRERAAGELVRRRDPRSVPCVLKLLREEVERRNGLSPEASAMLAELPLFAPPGAAEALETMADAVRAPAIRYHLSSAASAIRTVQRLGAEVDPWLALLNQGTAEEIDLAIRWLGELGDARAVEPLCRLIGRLEPARAHLVPQALGRIGSERATSFLVSLLTEESYRDPELRRTREEAVRALARYARSKHVAQELERAFRAEHARTVTPLLAYAHIVGREGIPRLMMLKRELLRRRGRLQVLRHEKVNWALRLLRTGRPIPWEELRDPS
ncbi:MAG: HEAT repeat domain-containing protein [Acidobacteria bacterium]|nr:MAG: HEAT repeat domain-containing protein [Acidobacteriota bacterium]